MKKGRRKLGPVQYKNHLIGHEDFHERDKTVVKTPDSKVHGANMEPEWGLSVPERPHVGPMHLAIRAILLIFFVKMGFHILVRWHLYIEMVPSAHFQYIKSTRISPLQGSYGVPVMLILVNIDLIARVMGPTWGPSGADRTQVGPMLPPWTLLIIWVSGWAYLSRAS